MKHIMVIDCKDKLCASCEHLGNCLGGGVVLVIPSNCM